MSSSPTLADLGEDVVAFLEVALRGRDPARESTVSDDILDAALDVLPRDDGGWFNGLAELSRPVVSWLVPRPEAWKEASELLAVYFRSAHVSVTTPHPRARSSIVSTPRFGAGKKHPVEVDLLVPVLRLLLCDADQGDRSHFLSSIDDWFVLSALEGVLPTLALSAAEMESFLRHFHEFAKADMARGSVEQAIKSWAGNHRNTSIKIIDKNLDAKELTLPSPVVQLLVEGAVGEHADLLPWRNEVIEKFARRNDEEAWKLAALLACFAWPRSHPPTTAQRHSELKAHIARLPERLLTTGLGAMSRDARSHPVASMKTAIELKKRWREKLRSDEERHEVDAQVVHAARSATWGLRDGGEDASALLFVLPELLTTPLQSYFTLDCFLADLAKCGKSAKLEVLRFLARWLASYFAELRDAHRTIFELLPLLEKELGHDEIVRWLVRTCVSTQEAERTTAFLLLAREDASSATPFYLDELSTRQARAFAHLLVAHRAFGAFWVHWLFALAIRDRPAATLASEILQTDALPDYPGLCRRLVAGMSDDETAGDLRALLEKRLDKWKLVHDEKVRIPELLTIRISAARWGEAMDRALRTAQRRTMQSGRFPLLALMQHVPIARGSGSVVGPQQTPTEFKKYETRMDAPFVETVDPVAAYVSKREHLRRAQQLLEVIEE